MRTDYVQKCISIALAVFLIGSALLLHGDPSCHSARFDTLAIPQCSAEFLSAPLSLFSLDDTAVLPIRLLFVMVLAAVIVWKFGRAPRKESGNQRIALQKFVSFLPRSFIRFYQNYPSYLYASQDP